MTAFERVMRVLGRPDDGYGGCASLARKLDIDICMPQRWRRRGWATAHYAERISAACANAVSRDDLEKDARAGDKRLT